MKSLSILATFYIELQTRFGKEKAFEIMRKLIIPIGCIQVSGLLQPLRTSNKKPMNLLISYLDLVDTNGVGQFGNKEMKHDDNICHRVVTKCPFHDFFTEVGTLELTRLFCEVDAEFYLKAFPEFEFHRNGSWKNTIAYGKDHCEFVFKRKK